MFKVIGLAWPGRDTDEDDFYMKIVALDEIHEFLVLCFSFEIINMLKK